MNRHQYTAANNLNIVDDNDDEFHAANADYSICLTIERCDTGFFARVDVVDGRGAVDDGHPQSHTAFDGDDGIGRGHGATMDEALAAVLASAPWQPIQYIAVGNCLNTADVDL